MSANNSHSRQPDTFMGYESFASLAEFREVLNQYQRDTGTAYVVRASKSAASYSRHTGRPLPSSVEYYRVQYVCIHNAKRAKETTDKRRFADHNCQATVGLLLDLNTMRMKVNRVCLRHSHDTFEDFPEVYSRNRRLTEEQMDDVFRLIDGFYSVDEVVRHISTNYNVAVTRYDVRNLRTKRQTKIKEISQLLSEVNEALLQLGSKRCKSELEKLYAYRNELRNVVRLSELSSVKPSPTIEPVLQPKADETESVPSMVQVTNLPSTSVQLTRMSCESSLASVQVASETAQAVNSIASLSVEQLENISPAAQLTSMSSPIQLASLPSDAQLTSTPSSSEQLFILPSSGQMVLLPSTVQLTGISSINEQQQYVLMPSTDNQLVLVPASSELISALSNSDNHQIELIQASAYMETELPASDQMEIIQSSTEVVSTTLTVSHPLEIMPSSTEVVSTTLPVSDPLEIIPSLSTYMDSTSSYISDQSMSPPKITVNLRDKSRRNRRLPYRYTIQ